MSLDSRLDSLKRQHVDLEAQIFQEDKRPRPDAALLSRLKVEKLRLKEEIERLNGRHGEVG